MLLALFPVSALPRSRSCVLYFRLPVRHLKNKRLNELCRFRRFLVFRCDDVPCKASVIGCMSDNGTDCPFDASWDNNYSEFMIYK